MAIEFNRFNKNYDNYSFAIGQKVSQEAKKAEETKTGLVSSETEIEMVDISELGRCLGSTEIKIEAELTNYYYTDDIICNLTLVTKTI